MLNITTDLQGCAIVALDGKIGHVSDVLFDDESWMVRWVVVTTGIWIPDRKVLLPTLVLGHLDTKKREFSVNLTKFQVKHSPDTLDYYDWAPYWIGEGAFLGGEIRSAAKVEGSDDFDGEDSHLRSAYAVKGYHIQANNGEIGHVQDFLMEDADWSLRYLVVETANWWPGKKTLISPHSVIGIDWSKSKISINVDREQVKNSPPYDAALKLDRAYTRKFDSYYADVLSGPLCSTPPPKIELP
jgi:sporulation protein YlmC with PRC-barrel domain